MVLFVLSAACVSLCRAQNAPPPLLKDQVPFDQLTLDKANDSKVLKIYPLKLPGRRVPDKPRPSDKLRVKLMDEEQEYEVAWVNIAKLELYEQMVLAEAGKLAAEGKLDDAYDVFDFLLTFYPNTPGLAGGRQSYLYASSAAAFRQQKYDEALALLEELHAQNPNFRAGENSPAVRERIGDVADRLIGDAVQKQDFATARALLARLTRQYKAEGDAFARKWREQLEELAARKRDEAKAHLEAGRFVEARDATGQMQAIWPDIAGGQELAAEVAKSHQVVRVGVEHPARSFDRLSLNDFATRRAGRLTQRLLVERTALGAEGGKYESPLGPIAKSDDGMTLTFRVPTRAGPTEVYDVAQRLLSRASAGSPLHDAAFGRIVSTVAVRPPSEVDINLRQAHVLPEALLMMGLFGEAEARAADQPFAILSQDESLVRLAANSEYVFRRAGQPAEIVERHFADPQRALMALKRGEIDMLDRVFLGDIAALRSDSALVVAPYAGPTTHVLAVRSSHPFLSNSSFRRGLVYGANRELILKQGLLRGATVAGCRVVSAPFPAPVSGMDLPTYGYDAQIEPRPYDPRLGLALVSLAAGELKAAFEKQKKTAPTLAPIVLGNPADEASRIACRALVKDWKTIGVECKLLEFPPGVFDDVDHKCDLVFLQLAAWEPVIDARRLLGDGGLAFADNDHIQLALRQLDLARNWQQVRERLLVLHRLLHEDQTLLPLWQVFDHFAYRRSLGGLAQGRLSLYQDVEQWTAAPALARSRP